MSQQTQQHSLSPLDATIRLSSCELQDLHELSATQGGMLTIHQVENLMREKSLSFKQLQDALLPICEFYAIAPISNFLAGAIVQGELNSQGLANLYFGANLEFPGQALSLVVHAEQAAIHNAWQHGEKKISGMTINAAPCGYCRQFINEVRGARQMPLNIAGQECHMDDLLPNPFSPETLGNEVMLFDATQRQIELVKTHQNGEINKSLQLAVETSYAPYSNNLSACEIETTEGQIVVGRYAENCAYSPSLSPVQAALSQLALQGIDPFSGAIASITLVELESNSNQLGVAQAVLESLPNNVRFCHQLAKLA